MLPLPVLQGGLLELQSFEEAQPSLSVILCARYRNVTRVYMHDIYIYICVCMYICVYEYVYTDNVEIHVLSGCVVRDQLSRGSSGTHCLVEVPPGPIVSSRCLHAWACHGRLRDRAHR